MDLKYYAILSNFKKKMWLLKLMLLEKKLENLIYDSDQEIRTVTNLTLVRSVSGRQNEERCWHYII